MNTHPLHSVRAVDKSHANRLHHGWTKEQVGCYRRAKKFRRPAGFESAREPLSAALAMRKVGVDDLFGGEARVARRVRIAIDRRRRNRAVEEDDESTGDVVG